MISNKHMCQRKDYLNIDYANFLDFQSHLWFQPPSTLKLSILTTVAIKGFQPRMRYVQHKQNIGNNIEIGGDARSNGGEILIF